MNWDVILKKCGYVFVLANLNYLCFVENSVILRIKGHVNVLKVLVWLESKPEEAGRF